MIGFSLVQRFFIACVTVLLAILALEWAAGVLERIWPTLAIAGAVVLTLAGVVGLIRWRSTHW